MAWIEATRAQHGRPHDDRHNHSTDAERAPMVPLISPCHLPFSTVQNLVRAEGT